MVLLACPQVIRDYFPSDLVPFRPALATPAGLPATGQYWYANWTCSPPLASGAHSLSGSPPPDNTPLLDSEAKATPNAFENVLLQLLCPPVQGPNAPVRIGSTVSATRLTTCHPQRFPLACHP